MDKKLQEWIENRLHYILDGRAKPESSSQDILDMIKQVLLDGKSIPEKNVVRRTNNSIVYWNR